MGGCLNVSTCWLCHKTAELCESHVIPKFVFRWLIDTGGTDYLRGGSAPNVRRQDGDKHRLYCRECENSLSKFEGQAKKKIFMPATRREDIFGSYGPWLSRFACSLAIRTIHSQLYRKITEKYDAHEMLAVVEAENSWRQFLLGRAGNPGKFKLHVIYIGYFDHFDAENLPQNWNTWVHRGVERDTIFTENKSFFCTYSKLGPLIFLGEIIDSNSLLGNDFLRCSEGFLGKRPFNISSSVWHLFLDRAKSADKILGSISDRQRAISEAEVEKNSERFADSELAKTLFDDYKQFGPKK